MAEKKGAAKSGGKNITVPSTAALRQQAVRGQAGGAKPAGQQQAKQAAPAAKQGKIEIMASRQFTNWLADQNASLAFTTYQVGKVFLLGLREDRKISLYERTFNRCMGLFADKDSMYLSSLYQLWQFQNVLAPGQKRDGFDRLYVPQVSYITGDIDIHDIAIDKHGRIIFVNTLFCCLATVSHTHSFAPVWKPKHISKLAAEDRCHLNGMAMENGSPKYVTSIGLSDAADGWREHRQDGGVILDVESSEVVLSGLSMPHSPRMYRGKLYVLNSGTGYFGSVDVKSGKFEPIAFCPGYMRGLAFINDFAIIGMSKCRENRTFSGLDLDDNLTKRKVEARCGVFVVDLNTGDLVQWVRLEGAVWEMYDVSVIPGVTRPMALGLRQEAIRRTISIGDAVKM